MSFFDVLNLIGGIALFLFGMDYMGESLKRTAGGKMQEILEKLTSNLFMGIMVGALVTAVIQASGATTVMVVGFVNSGIMNLTQAVGVIMGANIGTTATSWILSLSGINGESFALQLLKPTSWTPVLGAVGVAMIMFTKKDKYHNIGGIMMGFAILMFGMNTMTVSVAGLKDVPEFTHLMTAFSNPVLGVIVGAVITAAIQSSSASVGILQALCGTGTVVFSNAVPIIMGQNIGTCVTALISSIGASKNAKRTALIHFYFNFIGTIVFMILFYAGNAIFGFSFFGKAATASGIATVHSVFNIVTTLLWLPFTKLLVKLATVTVREKTGEEQEETQKDKYSQELLRLEPRFLSSPAYALQVAFEMTIRMMDYSRQSVLKAIALMKEFREDEYEKVSELEQAVDEYEDKLGTYLVQISGKELQQKDGRMVTQLMHQLGDIERISDYAFNVAISAKKMHTENLNFSKKAVQEISVMMDAINEIMNITYDTFESQNQEIASHVEPLEQAIDELNLQMKKRHIHRLQKGKCTIETGMQLTDFTTNMGRISDHCSNIAAAVIQIQDDSFDTHEYLNEVKRESPEFKEMFSEYMSKYELPAAKDIEDDEYQRNSDLSDKDEKAVISSGEKSDADSTSDKGKKGKEKDKIKYKLKDKIKEKKAKDKSKTGKKKK